MKKTLELNEIEIYWLYMACITRCNTLNRRDVKDTKETRFLDSVIEKLETDAMKVSKEN